MVSVRLEVLPGLTESLGGKGTESVFYDREIEEGSTVADVIRKIAAEHHAFHEIILDTKTNQIGGGLSVVLNGMLLGAPKDLDTQIKEGDLIRIFALVAGG